MERGFDLAVNLGAKLSEMSFPHLRPILLKSAIVIFRQH